MYYGDYHRDPQEPIETNQYRVHDPWDNGSAPAPAPRKKGSGAKIVALALCCALAGGLVGGFLGGKLYGRVSTKLLKWLFAAFLFYAGVKYLL